MVFFFFKFRYRFLSIEDSNSIYFIDYGEDRETVFVNSLV